MSPYERGWAIKEARLTAKEVKRPIESLFGFSVQEVEETVAPFRGRTAPQPTTNSIATSLAGYVFLKVFIWKGDFQFRDGDEVMSECTEEWYIVRRPLA